MHEKRSGNTFSFDEISRLNGWKQTVKGNRPPKFPDSAERELARIHAEYMKLLKRRIQEDEDLVLFLLLEEELSQERVEATANEIMRSADGYAFDIGRVANIVTKNATNEFCAITEKSIKALPDRSRYRGRFFDAEKSAWTQQCLDTIEAHIGKTLADYHSAFSASGTLEHGGKQLTSADSFFDARSYFSDNMARNAVGNFNAEVTKKIQTDFGIDSYVWSTRRDNKVRESHSRLNGTVQRWDSPPETDGKKCHPEKRLDAGVQPFLYLTLAR